MPRQKPGHVVKAQQAQKVRTQGQAERDGPPENTDIPITLRFMRVLIILFASFELVAHSAEKVYNSRSRMSRGGILCPFCPIHPPPAPAPPQVGRGTYSLPTGSAHADGGAAGVKKRFSLAARHRFFGQAPKKWGRKAAGAIDHRPIKRRTRKRVKKRGNPRRGFPLGPPPALL